MTNNYKLSPAAIFLTVSSAMSLFSMFSRWMNFGIILLNVLTLLANVFLCVVLYMKRRDLLLLIASAAVTFVSLINFFVNFGLISFLLLGANGFILILVLLVSDQNLIKLGNFPIAGFFKKFFYLPAAVIVFNFTVNFIRYLIWGVYFTSFIGLIIGAALNALTMYFLASWLLDPTITAVPFGMGYVYAGDEPVYGAAASGVSGAAPKAASQQIPEGSNYCPLGKHIVLTLVTFGVWFYMWIFKTTRYLNKAPGAQQYVPVKKMLLCLFIPYYYIYWFCKHARRLTDLSKVTNPKFADQNTMYILFGIFVPVVSCILMQVRINHLELGTIPGESAPATPAASAAPAAPAAPTAPAAPAVPAAPAASAATEQDTIQALRSYKELLDSGIITQEEFDTKKKQLLGL